MEFIKEHTINFGYPRGKEGRNGHKVIAIVSHIAEGSRESVVSWFKNAESKASSNYMVCKNGDVIEFVPHENTAWANGQVDNPDWELLKEDNPNLYTISIENEGRHYEELTEEQTQSNIELQSWLINEYDINPNHDTIIGHYRIDSVNKAKCPGPNFPFDRIINSLKSNIPKWKQSGLAYLRKQGYVTSDSWEADDKLDIGSLGAIIKKMEV